MNWDTLRQSLIRAARHTPANAAAVPAGFEQRVLARLRAEARSQAGAVSEWAAAARGLWFAAGACAAIAVAISVWSPAPDSSGLHADAAAGFAIDLEQTILASVSLEDLDPDLDPLFEHDLDLVW
jgi:hypothetical protein